MNMLILRRKLVVFSALTALLLALVAAGMARYRASVDSAYPSSSSRNLAAGPPASLDFSRLSAADRRKLASLKEMLRSGKNDGAETLLRPELPDLLLHGGAPLVDQLLAETPPGALRETLSRLCETLWPRVDASAALAWTAQLSDPAERAAAYERVLSSLAELDPARAVEVAAKRDASGEGNGALTANLVGAWAAADLQASRRWALGLPPGEWRDSCVARTATVEARSFPADAVRFALKRLPPGPVLDEALISTVYYWAGRDAAQARRWAENLPPGAFRDRALAEANGVVTASDPPVEFLISRHPSLVDGT